jgi:para-aminobenzoate synthetase
MRVLLIDNHDSFTAILGHYLWTLSGERPMVVRNDELTRDELETLDFDAAVLSPGPGHPANVRDFGICRDLLELFPGKPVLGVCLGMQGMAHFAGARVIPLEGARHGRPSRIVHDGSGIFRGLPEEFSAIRYHSLVVEEDSLPAGLRVSARSAEDGQVMGIAFADRPWFGVQFHPESVGTEFGMKLLGNFLDIASPGGVRRGATGGEDIPNDAMAGIPIPLDRPLVPHRELAWRDPAEVFARHFKDREPAFWLDGPGWGATVMGRADAARTFADWKSFAAWLDASTPDGGMTAPWSGYRGGPVGQLSYELHQDLSGVPAHSVSGEPLARWMLPEGYLVFDRAAGRAYAAWEGAAPPAWLRAIVASWDDAIAPDPVASASARLPSFSAWRPLLEEGEHAARVRALQDAIARGESYETCLTHAYSADADADALEVFLRLRARNPAPYAAWQAFGDARILSASPELFLEGLEDGMLRSRPIKGTRRRGTDTASDAALRADLATSEKDAAENRMIVDLTRHDLARSCRPGSVEVPEFLRIEEHPAVFQLVSEVRGRRAPGVSVSSAVATCFPGGSMTGAPKERAMELLAALEAEPRGVYSGAIGYFTRGGAFTLSMAIRVLENRGRAWRVGCGGAVLADSEAVAEWGEAVVKARSVIDAAGGPV